MTTKSYIHSWAIVVDGNEEFVMDDINIKYIINRLRNDVFRGMTTEYNLIGASNASIWLKIPFHSDIRYDIVHKGIRSD